MRLALGLSLVVVVVGCKKEGQNATGGSPIAAASTDSLWAFAPADARVAIVAADGALEPLHAAGLRLLADLEKAPGGAAIAQQIKKPAANAPFDVLDPKSLAAVGIDLARGAAYFDGPSGEIAVLPLSDPKKFLALVHATSENGVDRFGKQMCKPVRDRYVCAASPEALAATEKVASPTPVAAWPPTMRGHIEMYISAEKLGGGAPMTDPEGVRVAAVIERGAVTVRMHLVGTPAGPLAKVRGGKSGLTAGLADKQPVGLLVVNAISLWEGLKAEAAAKSAGAPPLPGGVAAADVATAIRGDMVGYALPGQPLRGLARIGLTREEPVAKLLGACAELAAAAPPGVTLAAAKGRCTVTVDPAVIAPQVPGLPAMKLEAWVEDGALVLGFGDHTASSSARPGLAPFAREILDGDFVLASWGQGSLAGGPMMATRQQLDQLRAQDPTGGLAVWAIHHLSEFGIAVRIADDGIHAALRVRTLWANPDAVVTAVQAAIGEFASGKIEALATMSKIAEEHPDTPFAHDMQSGPAGMVAPMAAVGILAAVSIPAFMSYMNKSKSSEASIMVRRLYSGAQMKYAESAAYPAAGAGPTPPLGACCQQPQGRCAPDPALWAGEPWTALEFSIDDPSRYSYEYRPAPDGKSFTVSAYGDLDCDGAYSTFSAQGTGDAPTSFELTRSSEEE